MSVLSPTCFRCAVCGAEFVGTLNEAADAAFAHSAEHADKATEAQRDLDLPATAMSVSGTMR